jgi:hypothetical protein
MRYFILVLGVLVFGGCGGEPFSHVGEGASDWIGRPTVETTATTGPGPGLAPVNRIDWVNRDLAPVGGTTPAEIISGVYTRAKPSDPFVQATPQEIALALPGLVFPSLLPPEVRYVTSQLIYDLSTVTLASEEVAAFGLWTVEPYTRSRSVGQQGVLTVVADAEGIAALESGTADTSCARYLAVEAECAVNLVSESPAWELRDPNGETLVWYGDSFRYELFLRSGVNPELAVQIAESSRPLANVAR